MTAQNDLDRALGAWFQGEATTAPPPEPLARVIKATAGLRPRPGPFASLGSSWTRERETGRGTVSLPLTLVGVLRHGASRRAARGGGRMGRLAASDGPLRPIDDHVHIAPLRLRSSHPSDVERAPGDRGLAGRRRDRSTDATLRGHLQRWRLAHRRQRQDQGGGGSGWNDRVGMAHAPGVDPRRGGQCFGSATPWTNATVAGIAARRFEWRCDSPSANADYDEVMFLNAGAVYVITGNPAMVDVLIQSFRAP